MKNWKSIFSCLTLALVIPSVSPSFSQTISPEDFKRESREAERFMIENRYDIAQKILLKLIATHHGTAIEYSRLAFCYMNTLPEQQDFHAAELCAKKAISLDPVSGYAYNALAEARMNQDDLLGTVAAATRALTCAYPDKSAHYLRARAYAALEKYPEALKDFEEYDLLVRKWKGRQDNVNFESEGNLLVLMGRPDEAIAKYRADKPFRLEEATKNIVSCLRKQKKYSEAIAEASTLIQHNPKDSDSLNLRGSLKADTKDWKGAIADYTSAISISPTATYYKNRSQAYEALGQAEQARKDLLNAQKL